jgi:NAD(P)-dependent dehydrogenase (short-subunit alcohol dehydrogenase family)
MKVRLKPLEDQVVVLTGASSGIGLSTARALAAQGARLVLVSRNARALEEVALECSRLGSRAVAAPADVANREDLERVAQIARDEFGGFDTWINNAAVAIYGSLDQVPLEDQRRLFDVNYWGVVHGSLIAARHLRDRGGAIINTGSVLSDRSVNLQGPYSASKHAVKAFTDSLRMELEASGAPVSVTLIKPSGIDTEYMEHARNYLDSPGIKVPPPSYDPSVVAKAMLFACEHPRRDLVVGFGGWAIAAMGNLMPRGTDLLMEGGGRLLQVTDNPGRSERRDNLYEPREDLAERSSLPGPSRKTSLFLEAQMHPVATAALVAGLGALAFYGLQARGGGARDDRSEVFARREHAARLSH